MHKHWPNKGNTIEPDLDHDESGIVNHQSGLCAIDTGVYTRSRRISGHYNVTRPFYNTLQAVNYTHCSRHMPQCLDATSVATQLGLITCRFGQCVQLARPRRSTILLK